MGCLNGLCFAPVGAIVARFVSSETRMVVAVVVVGRGRAPWRGRDRVGVGRAAAAQEERDGDERADEQERDRPETLLDQVGDEVAQEAHRTTPAVAVGREDLPPAAWLDGAVVVEGVVPPVGEGAVAPPGSEIGWAAR